MTARLERLVDELIAQRPLRPVFVVPGANTVSAGLDLARTIVRRAERRLVGYRAATNARRPDNQHVLTYLSLRSDVHAAGDHEEPVSHAEAPDP